MNTDELTIIQKTIERDCEDHGLGVESAQIAWKIGLAAFIAAMSNGASFPHHRSEPFINPAIEGLIDGYDDPRR